MRAPGRSVLLVVLGSAACHGAGGASASLTPPTRAAAQRTYWADELVPCPSPEVDDSQPVYEFTDVAVPVRVAVTVAPLYPPELRQRGATGEVVLGLVVNAAGCAEPGSIRVVRSADPAFVAAAREAALRIRFHPAERDGRPVRQRVYVPYSFEVRR